MGYGTMMHKALLTATVTATVAVLAAAAADGGERLRPSRAYPGPAGWLLPAGRSQRFRAELTDSGRTAGHARWRLMGPRDRGEPRPIDRSDGKVTSTYVLRPPAPGTYTLTCTFVAHGADSSSVCWEVRVTEGGPAAYGRVVDPEELDEMVFIEGGTFRMGVPPGSDSGRLITVGDLWVRKYPVTASEFCEFLNDMGNEGQLYLRFSTGTTRAANIEYDSHADRYGPVGDVAFCPVGSVTWVGAVEYCKWLSARTGREYRLPTGAGSLSRTSMRSCSEPSARVPVSRMTSRPHSSS